MSPMPLTPDKRSTFSVSAESVLNQSLDGFLNALNFFVEKSDSPLDRSNGVFIAYGSLNAVFP